MDRDGVHGNAQSPGALVAAGVARYYVEPVTKAHHEAHEGYENK
jgi:hypothetical protein